MSTKQCAQRGERRGPQSAPAPSPTGSTRWQPKKPKPWWSRGARTCITPITLLASLPRALAAADNPSYPHLARRFDKVAKELLSAVRKAVIPSGSGDLAATGRFVFPAQAGGRVVTITAEPAGLNASIQPLPPTRVPPQLPDANAVASLQGTPQGVVRSFYPLQVRHARWLPSP